MRLKPFLCCTSLLVLLALPAAAEPLAPRGEVSVKGGTDRSLLTTEFWAPLAQQSDRVLYGDIRLMGDNDENREGNLGLGYRQIKNDAVVGVHGWIDRRRTQHNSTFHQLTFGVERLGHVVDARANVYIPINNGRNITTRNIGVTSPYLAGSGIYYDTNGSISETPQYGLDGELGYRIPVLQKHVDAIRVYGGGYYFFRDNTVEVPGARFRTEAQVNKIFSVGARVQYDKPRGTQGFLEATLKFPFSAKRLYQESGIRSRLDESPERDVDIVTDSKVTDTGLRKPVVNTATGTQQRILYVDNSKTDGGDGSYEKPFNSLKAAEAALQANDILYINRGDGTTRNMDQGIVINQQGVSVIGSGSDFIFDANRYTTSLGNNFSGVSLIKATSHPLISNTRLSTDNYTGVGVFVTSDNILISGIAFDPSITGNNIFIENTSGYSWKSVIIDNVSLNSTNYKVGGREGIRIISNSSLDSILINNVSSSNNSRGINITSNVGTIKDISILNSQFLNAQNQGITIVASNSGAIDNLVIKRNMITGGNVGLNLSAQAASAGANTVINHALIDSLETTNTTGDGVLIFSNTTGQQNKIEIINSSILNSSTNGVRITTFNAGSANVSLSNNTIIGNGTNSGGAKYYGVHVDNDGTGIFSVDLGGGILNSPGNNRIYNNFYREIFVDSRPGAISTTPGVTISAQHNWWGVNTGLNQGTRTTFDNGSASPGSSIDATNHLTIDPRP